MNSLIIHKTATTHKIKWAALSTKLNSTSVCSLTFPSRSFSPLKVSKEIIIPNFNTYKNLMRTFGKLF